MDALSSGGFDAPVVARLGTTLTQQRVQTEVAVARKTRDVQAEASLALVEAISDVGRLVDVRA